jgi:hypothetical protein
MKEEEDEGKTHENAAMPRTLSAQETMEEEDDYNNILGQQGGWLLASFGFIPALPISSAFIPSSSLSPLHSLFVWPIFFIYFLEFSSSSVHTKIPLPPV